jgi:parallel beta-helix repeat protein
VDEYLMNKDIAPILAILTLSLSLLDASYIPALTNRNTINVPQDYPTIQQALDAADPGEKIQVTAGTYEEDITVEKSLTLKGEGPGNTIIDGKGTRNVVTVKASNVKINGFTIRNGSYGIYIGYSTACTLRDNHIEDNRWNLAVWGDEWQHYVHDIDPTNLVDGKPVYYWINQRERRVPTDAGFVAVINCTQITVENLNLTPNEQGVLFLNTEESTIRKVTTKKSDLGIYLLASHNNLIINNTIEFVSYKGILLWSSHKNTITGNTLRNGILGVGLQTSNNNTIYHNNFIDNKVQLESYGSSNTWDNGEEGNYWSDYSGEDLDGNGIGDTFVPHLGVDYYPLTRPWSTNVERPFPWQIIAVVSVVAISIFTLFVLFRKLSNRERKGS